MNRKKIVQIFVFFIFSLSFSFSAWYNWDISGWLKQKYYSDIGDEGFYKIAKQFNFGDIYKTIYSNLSVKDVKSYKFGIEFLKNKLLSDCNISDNEIKVVLEAMGLNNYTDTQGFKNILPNISEDFSPQKTYDVCKKILYCIYPRDRNLIFGKSGYNNVTILYKCFNWVSFYLLKGKESYDLISKMRSYNIGNEVLVNGDPSDGPFDLLVDIYELRKLLFQNDDGHIKPPKKIRFYEPVSQDLGDSNGGSSVNNSNDLENNQNQEDVYNGLFGNSEIVDNDQNLKDKQTFDIIKNDFNMNKNETSDQKIVNNVNCFNNNLNNNLQKVLDNINNQYISSSTNKNYENNKNIPSNFSNSFNPLTENPINNLNKNESNLTDLLNKIHELFESPKNSIEKENTNIGFGKNNLFCGGANTEGMLGVSICFIPSGIKIPPKQKVYSVEDILNQILRIATLLKDSGQLMKHVYTDEWWETRLQDIKLDRIFVFDIVLMKKKLFENLDEDTDEKKEFKKEQQKLKFIDLQHQIGITYGEDLSNRLERNKYVVLGQGKYYFEYNNRYFTPDYVFNFLQEEGKTIIQNEIAKFFDYNKYYWGEVDKILLQIRKWSTYLYAEIPK